MVPFSYRQGELYVENVRAADLAARFGTPTLVYSADALRGAAQRYKAAFAEAGSGVIFAVKACPTVGCLRRIVGAGLGVCATSGADLERAWLAGAAFPEAVLAGVAKTDDELRAAFDGIYSPLFQAGLTVNDRPPYYRGPVGWIVAESLSELDRIAATSAGLRVRPNVALRVHPDLSGLRGVRAPSASETKFGLPAAAAAEVFDRYRGHPSIRLAGIHAHVAGVSRDPAFFGQVCERLASLAVALGHAGHELAFIDAGGGFASLGVAPSSPGPEAYAERLSEHLGPLAERGVKVVVEPGRALTAGAAVLLTTVRDTRRVDERTIHIIDAGLEPSRRPHEDDGFRLAWPASVAPGHEPAFMPGVPIAPSLRSGGSGGGGGGGGGGGSGPVRHGMVWTDLIGPGPEDRDVVSVGRLLPPVETEGLVAIFAAGAYADETLALGRGHAPLAEVIVDGTQPTQVRGRGTFDDRLGPEMDAIQQGR